MAETGAERYLHERLHDPEYQAAYAVAHDGDPALYGPLKFNPNCRRCHDERAALAGARSSVESDGTRTEGDPS